MGSAGIFQKGLGLHILIPGNGFNRLHIKNKSAPYFYLKCFGGNYKITRMELIGRQAAFDKTDLPEADETFSSRMIMFIYLK